MRRPLPVYDAVGLLRPDDAQGVDSGVGGGQVRVLSGAPRETPGWALAVGQELTHTRQGVVGDNGRLCY